MTNNCSPLNLQCCECLDDVIEAELIAVCFWWYDAAVVHLYLDGISSTDMYVPYQRACMVHFSGRSKM